MDKFTIKLKAPKARNKVARAVLDPQGAYRPKAERDRTKYNRKNKHKKSVDKD